MAESVQLVGGVDKWVFVIDDGEDAPLLSAEGSDETGRVVMVQRHSIGGSPSEDWAVVFSEADARSLGFSRFADHWHIYAHGVHWIAVSLIRSTGISDEACGVGVVCINGDRRVIAGPIIVEDDTNADTNDLTMVEIEGGVAILFKYDLDDLRVVEVDASPSVLRRIDVPRDSTGPVRQNTASCLRVDDRVWRYLTPDRVTCCSGTVIRSYDFDADWNPSSPTTLLDGAGAEAFGMPMACSSSLGYRFVVAKVVPQGDTSNTDWCVDCDADRDGVWDGDVGRPDYGRIVLYAIPTRGGIATSHIVLAEKGNRPHVYVIGGYVVVGYDTYESYDEATGLTSGDSAHVWWASLDELVSLLDLDALGSEVDGTALLSSFEFREVLVDVEMRVKVYDDPPLPKDDLFGAAFDRFDPTERYDSWGMAIDRTAFVDLAAINIVLEDVRIDSWGTRVVLADFEDYVSPRAVASYRW